MNERIQELEKQCWSHRVDGVLVDGHLHFDAKKFAGLIVKECNELNARELSAAASIKMFDIYWDHFGVGG